MQCKRLTEGSITKGVAFDIAGTSRTGLGPLLVYNALSIGSDSSDRLWARCEAFTDESATGEKPGIRHPHMCQGCLVGYLGSRDPPPWGRQESLSDHLLVALKT